MKTYSVYITPSLICFDSLNPIMSFPEDDVTVVIRRELVVHSDEHGTRFGADFFILDENDFFNGVRVYEFTDPARTHVFTKESPFSMHVNLNRLSAELGCTNYSPTVVHTSLNVTPDKSYMLISCYGDHEIHVSQGVNVTELSPGQNSANDLYSWFLTTMDDVSYGDTYYVSTDFSGEPFFTTQSVNGEKTLVERIGEDNWDCLCVIGRNQGSLRTLRVNVTTDKNGGDVWRVAGYSQFTDTSVTPQKETERELKALIMYLIKNAIY